MFQLPCIHNWLLRHGSCQMCADLAFNCLFFAPLSRDAVKPNSSKLQIRATQLSCKLLLIFILFAITIYTPQNLLI
ncbi:unnamed protein product [Brassica rapa subsp. narinosa]